MAEAGIALNVPAIAEPVSQVVVARQWRLIWWKFRRHRLAMIGGVVTLLIYLVALGAEFLAPFAPDAFASKYTYAPPQTLHLFDQAMGTLQFQPYVNGYKVTIDYAAGRRNFEV